MINEMSQSKSKKGHQEERYNNICMILYHVLASSVFLSEVQSISVNYHPSFPNVIYCFNFSFFGTMY